MKGSHAEPQTPVSTDDTCMCELLLGLPDVNVSEVVETRSEWPSEESVLLPSHLSTVETEQADRAGRYRRQRQRGTGNQEHRRDGGTWLRDADR